MPALNQKLNILNYSIEKKITTNPNNIDPLEFRDEVIDIFKDYKNSNYLQTALGSNSSVSKVAFDSIQTYAKSEDKPMQRINLMGWNELISDFTNSLTCQDSSHYSFKNDLFKLSNKEFYRDTFAKWRVFSASVIPFALMSEPKASTIALGVSGLVGLTSAAYINFFSSEIRKGVNSLNYIMDEAKVIDDVINKYEIDNGALLG